MVAALKKNITIITSDLKKKITLFFFRYFRFLNHCYSNQIGNQCGVDIQAVLSDFNSGLTPPICRDFSFAAFHSAGSRSEQSAITLFACVTSFLAWMMPSWCEFFNRMLAWMTSYWYAVMWLCVFGSHSSFLFYMCNPGLRYWLFRWTRDFEFPSKKHTVV